MENKELVESLQREIALMKQLLEAKDALITELKSRPATTIQYVPYYYSQPYYPYNPWYYGGGTLIGGTGNGANGSSNVTITNCAGGAGLPAEFNAGFTSNVTNIMSIRDSKELRDTVRFAESKVNW